MEQAKESLPPQEPKEEKDTYDGYDTSTKPSKTFITAGANERRCWLVYDLGLRGNYEGLYVWLDKMQAEECGDNVATFSTEKTRTEIKQELSEFLNENVRAYFIDSRDSKGGFIKGGRKKAPWEGYGKEQVEIEEE
ncbi:MAG: hypothetical protein FIB07_13475 [Candidatus Methanoperedens sp.]|nr:hypothetical protein [Candidatus Methanoperedens sp.]